MRESDTSSRKKIRAISRFIIQPILGAWNQLLNFLDSAIRTLGFRRKGSLLVFSCFLKKDHIPTATKIYFEGLLPYFDDHLFVYAGVGLSESEVQYFKEKDVKLLQVENHGYDFGMYQKVFRNIGKHKYNRVGLTNDSVLLCGDLNPFFNWEKKCKGKAIGMIDSHELKYHLQSYFLILKDRSIPILYQFLDSLILSSDKQAIIDQGEIKLSRLLIKKKIKLQSYYRTDNYMEDFKLNPSFLLIERLLEDKIPIIKKRILTNNYDEQDFLSLEKNHFDFSPDKYLEIIKKNNPNFTFDIE